MPVVAGYRDFTKIGAGGFATVYRATREAFGQTVAVKFVDLDGAPESVQMRFDRECRALGALAHHPHIVTVYDAGVSESGTPYLVMEYLPHGSLDRADRMMVADVLRLGVQVAGALETAHRAEILHRDVKPANILRTRYGDPVLADFGIARLAGGSRTTSGVVTASVAYAPPEVLEGKHPTSASDVWSLAATLVCLLTGRTPFAQEAGDGGVPALIARIVRDQLPDLVALGVPAEVADPLLRALAADPHRRTPTALEFGRGLREVQRSRGERETELLVEGVSGESERPAVAWTSVPPLPRSPTTISGPARPIVGAGGVPDTVPFPRPPLAIDDTARPRARSWLPSLVMVLLALGVTTLAGIVVIEIFVGLGDSSGSETQEDTAGSVVRPVTSPTTPTAPSALTFPPGLAGTWNGFVASGDGSGTTYEVIVTFAADSDTARVRSEDIRYGQGESGPALNCRGRWELEGQDARGVLSVVETTEFGECASDVPITLTPRPDTGSLRMLSEAPGWTDTATLSRADVPPAR